MIYFEFSQPVVNRGIYPSMLCCSQKMVYTNRKSQMADRIFVIEGNNLIEIKNRNGTPSTMYISDEDKLVLRLKAVLI